MKGFRCNSLPKTNIAAGNQWLEDEISFWGPAYFQGRTVRFREGIPVSQSFGGIFLFGVDESPAPPEISKVQFILATRWPLAIHPASVEIFSHPQKGGRHLLGGAKIGDLRSISLDDYEGNLHL